MGVLRVADLQIGSGELYLDGRNVGAFVDAAFTNEIETITHESGMPRKIDKVVITSQRPQITASLREINSNNLAIALGVEDTNIETVSAGGVAVTEEVVKLNGTSWVALQYRPLDESVSPTVRLATKLTQAVSATDTVIYVEDATGFDATDQVKVAGQTLTISSVSGNEITLSSAVGATASVGDAVINLTDTFTENTDYDIDYPDGRIRALSGGALANAGYVAVDYTYTALSSVRVPLGAYSVSKIFVVELKLKRDDGWMVIHFNRGQVTGNLNMPFNETDWQSIPITITGLADPNYNDYAGYIEFSFS